MQELIINRNDNQKTICLVKDGELVERYDENSTILERVEGNIYIGKVEDVILGMQAAFVNIGNKKNGLIHFSDVLPKVDITKEYKVDNQSDIIKEKLVKGNKILVQVKKDSDQLKGARLTTHISLVGKYLVIMPETTIITISQKITDSKEKERLKDVIKNILPDNTGVIIRTSAISKGEEELKSDLDSLLKRWEDIKEIYNSNVEFPRLVEENNNITKKIILDTVEKDIKNVYVNNKEDYEEIKGYIESLKPTNKIEVILKDKEDLLDRYDIRKQIAKSNRRKIWLNCGGFITIDKTEALTAIDVNSGKFTGNKNLEDTVLKVNIEATKEIAKQIRLRDIGGIIVIDYIDMKNIQNKEKIRNILIECLKEDRSKTQVLEFTKLNLLELTRKHIFSNNKNLEEKEDAE